MSSIKSCFIFFNVVIYTRWIVKLPEQCGLVTCHFHVKNGTGRLKEAAKKYIIHPVPKETRNVAKYKKRKIK